MIIAGPDGQNMQIECSRQPVLTNSLHGTQTSQHCHADTPQGAVEDTLHATRLFGVPYQGGPDPKTSIMIDIKGVACTCRRQLPS